MIHDIWTRSAYDAAYPWAANKRRLELLRGVTARSLAAQTDRDFTWLLRVHPDDPFLSERTAIAESVGGRAVTGEPPRGDRLTTRLDDDDALMPDAIERIHRAAAKWRDGRVAFVMPNGWRYYRGRVTAMHHPRNQFLTLAASDDAVVMDFKHKDAGQFAKVVQLDKRPAWLWVRHQDARTGMFSAGLPVPAELRSKLDIDWRLLGTVT